MPSLQDENPYSSPDAGNEHNASRGRSAPWGGIVLLSSSLACVVLSHLIPTGDFVIAWVLFGVPLLAAYYVRRCLTYDQGTGKNGLRLFLSVVLLVWWIVHVVVTFTTWRKSLLIESAKAHCFGVQEVLGLNDRDGE